MRNGLQKLELDGYLLELGNPLSTSSSSFTAVTLEAAAMEDDDDGTGGNDAEDELP